MLRVPYLLNRLVGPFCTGVFTAAVASTDEPALAAILLIAAAVFAFLSLPGKDRLIARLLLRFQNLATWPAE